MVPGSWVSGHLANRCPETDTVLGKDVDSLFVSVQIMQAELNQQISRNLTRIRAVGACYKQLLTGSEKNQRQINLSGRKGYL